MNGIENTGISTSTNVTTIVNKEYSAGERIIDILKDLAEGGYQFTIIGDTLHFGEFVGENRSI